MHSIKSHEIKHPCIYKEYETMLGCTCFDLPVYNFVAAFPIHTNKELGSGISISPFKLDNIF